MKTHTVKDIVRRLTVVSLTIIFFMMLLGVGYAKSQKSPGPPFAFPGGKRGQEAINALQDRLPKVASRYGKSAEKLKKLFKHDKDIWLDPADNLLYICNIDATDAATPPELSDGPIPTGPFPLNQTFQLHSLAGASKVIYLDFDGHVTAGTYWNSSFNGGADIVSQPYDFNGNTSSFSDAELSRIQNIWARVAEDFAMYNIDVTTEDPGTEALRNSGAGDQNYGIRVVISPSSSWYGSAGGVAYVGSFDWSSDTPTFVFSDRLGSGNEKYVTDATSHETGHTLGLSHDGTTGGTSYYSGHGSWAPIMGVGYYKAVTQWSKGEYSGANNTEDDLAVMLNNGASYRPDDHGDWIDSATILSGDFLDASGLIERTGDIDVFGFQTEAGVVTIDIDPADLDPNLDILVQLLDDGGNVAYESDPINILPASLNLNLPGGTYYILVDGVGTGNPSTGYSDYASLGQYFISGTLPTTQFPPAAPADLSALPTSSSQINLSWTDNSNNENGFAIERLPDGETLWEAAGFVAANTTTYADTGLNINTLYHYRVSAYNVVGSSGNSNNASATTFDLPPNAPSDLRATTVSADQIELIWNDNSSNESGFAVERSQEGGSGWEGIATVAENTFIHTDNGLAAGTTYSYRVVAHNVNGNSGYTNTASATTPEVVPESPANLGAVAVSPTQVDLSWQDTSSNETGFKVERSDEGSEPWTVIATLSGNTTSFSDSTATPGTTFYYRVYSHNSAGDSGYSNTAVATTDEPPQFIDQNVSQEAAIAGTLNGTFVQTRFNDSGVESITEITSGGKPSKRYSYLEHKWMVQIQPGTSMTLYANAWASMSAAGDTFVFSYATDDENYTEMFTVDADYDDDNYYVYLLPANLSGTVYIRVQDTLRSAGTFGKSTLYLDHLLIRTDNEPGSLPLAPSGLAATDATFDSITLSWTDNADNELGYYIERFSAGAGWERVGSTGQDAGSFTDTGLVPGETFSYQVQAFNAAGVSDFTNMVNTGTTQGNSLHVADLDYNSEQSRNRWNAHAIITVHDQNNAPVDGVTVEGAWDTGKSSSCVTDSIGQCTVSNMRLKTSITSTSFSVTGLTQYGYIYDPASNVQNANTASRP